jgi:anti-sigma28 factor (negative regulator of flagellin synthesis)
MSMRIESQTGAKITSNVRSAEVRAAGPDSTTGHMLVSSLGTDNVSLSSASGLASLAKTLMPQDKQAKIAALTSQVRSGQYRAEASQVSRSLIQGHLNN